MIFNNLPDQEPKANSPGDLGEKKFERRIKYLDLFVKLLAGGVISMLIWYLGSRAEDNRQQIAEANRKMTYLMEFSAK